jgi:hypothetical protein
MRETPVADSVADTSLPLVPEEQKQNAPQPPSGPVSSGAPEQFWVLQFFRDGSYEVVRHGVGAEEAVRAAKHYTSSVAVQLGVVDRVIICDADDHCCFEWKRGKGLTVK